MNFSKNLKCVSSNDYVCIKCVEKPCLRNRFSFFPIIIASQTSFFQITRKML